MFFLWINSSTSAPANSAAPHIHRQQLRSSVVQVAVEFPGKTHATVGLSIFLGAQIVGIGGGGLYKPEEVYSDIKPGESTDSHTPSNNAVYSGFNAVLVNADTSGAASASFRILP